MNKTGQLIRKTRFEKGISQVQIAKKLNCTSQFVANWERGASAPPLKYIKPICKFVGIGINDMKAALMEDYAYHLDTEIK